MRDRKLKFTAHSLAKLGENNPMWKGEDVGYSGIHCYIRNRKEKPLLCENCNEVEPTDLANISGEYKRTLDDWEYLCRKCHMDKDGRNEKLRESGKSRRFPDKTCLVCGKFFHRTSGMRTAKYCSRQCFYARCNKDSRNGGI